MARYAVQNFTAGFNEALSTGDTHLIRGVLRSSGVCILPSDTCYAVAGDPTRRGVPGLINDILQRNPEMGMSLSFGSQLMLEKYVNLGTRDYRVLDSSSREKPVTLVAPMKKERGEVLYNALPAALHADPGFLGVRLSFSAVERQISNEYGMPLTTVAIYYSNGEPMRNFDDAITFVVANLEKMSARVPIAAIKHPEVRSAGVSTVVGFSKPTQDHSGITIYREGATEAAKLEKIAGRLTLRDVEDWT